MAEEEFQRSVVNSTIAKDMRKVFDGIGHLCTALDISRPTWQRVYSDQSVKFGTATKLVQNFFALLSDIAEGRIPPQGAMRPFGLILFEKYRDDISALRFEPYVEAYVAPETERSENRDDQVIEIRPQQVRPADPAAG